MTADSVTIAPTSDGLTDHEEARLERYATELDQWCEARRNLGGLPFSALTEHLVSATTKAADDLRHLSAEHDQHTASTGLYGATVHMAAAVRRQVAS